MISVQDVEHFIPLIKPLFDGLRSVRDFFKRSVAKSPTLTKTAVLDRAHSFLFLAPPKREFWKAKIRFYCSCESVQIRLDYSAHSGGIGRGFWGEGMQLLVKGATFCKGRRRHS